jgi:hypothetical protein
MKPNTFDQIDQYKWISNFIADKSLEWMMARPVFAIDKNDFQYMNANTNRSLFLLSDEILSRLDPNQTYINIGTGGGFLEYINKRKYKLEMETCDLPPNKINPLYRFIQKELKVKLTIHIGWMRNKDATDLTIGSATHKYGVNKKIDPWDHKDNRHFQHRKWDTAIFNRFVPLRKTLVSKQNIESFNKHMKKYVDNIIIYTFIDSYPDLNLFPKNSITEISGDNTYKIEYSI